MITEMCCIDGCESESQRQFEQRPYCNVHWQEARDEAVLAGARQLGKLRITTMDILFLRALKISVTEPR
jgi:hypothetical protein